MGEGKNFFSREKKFFPSPKNSVDSTEADDAYREEQDLEYQFAWGKQSLAHILYALIEISEWSTEG